MSLNITQMIEKIKLYTGQYTVYTPMSPAQWGILAKDSIKDLYILTSSAGAYDESLFEYDTDGVPTAYNAEFTIDMAKYIEIGMELIYMYYIYGEKAGMVSYTSDALSITKADNPSKEIRARIDMLKEDRTILHYKLASVI